MILSNLVLAAILSLSHTNPAMQIQIDEGFVENDVAQAARHSGPGYEETRACQITIDRMHFRDAVDNMRTARIRIAHEKFYDFIVLHEMAHCFDGVPAPAGVDAIEWREFLADVYAASELLASGQLDMSEYSQLIKFRDGLPNAFRNNALRDALPSVVGGKPGKTPAERIAAAKALRSEVFASRRGGARRF